MKKIILMLMFVPFAMMAQNNSPVLDRMGLKIVSNTQGIEESVITGIAQTSFDYFRMVENSIKLELTYNSKVVVLELDSEQQMFSKKRYVHPTFVKDGKKWRNDNNVAESTLIKVTLDSENNLINNTL